MARTGFRGWYGKRANSFSLEQCLLHQKARKIVNRAIYRKTLERKPCEVCGIFGVDAKGTTLLEAHHDDYNKPLEVRWLCVKHHREWHKHNVAIPIQPPLVASHHLVVVVQNP